VRHCQDDRNPPCKSICPSLKSPSRLNLSSFWARSWAFISGVFGVGGGFLTTPLLIFMGIPAPIAVGTQSCQLVASGIGGVMGYWRRGNVDFLIGSVMLVGGIMGAAIGIFFFRSLQYIGQIDLVISVLYIVLLGSIGLMMLFEGFFYHH
jgi:uncharacterized membrane protein YfcA